MRNFAEYYKELLEWEDIEFQELISDWREDLIIEIQNDFQSDVNNSRLKGLTFVPNKTNQSAGNQLDVLAVNELNEHLNIFKIEKCPGNGYPDRILARGDFKHIALEMKATGGWNPKDTNRRVLTSSSINLRARFTAPIYHLICTVIYQNLTVELAEIIALRLDFVEPTTLVGVRFEATVSHKILSSGTHKSIVL